MDALEQAILDNADQGSEYWENIRLGRFTASEWHKLMEFGKRAMTKEELAARPKKGKGSATTQVIDPSKMSDKGIKYIRQKVAEVLTGQATQTSYAYPMVYGKEMEPHAIEFFIEKTGFTYTPVAFVPYGDHAGGSPDGFINEDEGLEVKCPANSDNQISYLLLTDQWDLKAHHPDHYWQCMCNMKFSNKSLWHFVAYDPRMKEDKHKMHHIRIKPIEEDYDLIDASLISAVEEKLKLIKSLG